MDTPICDFVNEYEKSAALRLHMPGHKGFGPLGLEAKDITEIPGADVLYSPEGPILKSQQNAASLFGAGKTLYSVEGSSLSIKAMLHLALLWGKEQGREPLIAAGRNAHKAFMYAAALLDFDVFWLFGENRSSLLSCSISPEYLEVRLSQMDRKPVAVYITSPDYLGNMADLSALSEVCRRHQVLLLVDNAHGAYLNFLPQSLHPIALGADLCCDSAHKTLPVLTGGAYLHISAKAPALFFTHAERAMALFASTSPSYLIMQSLDMANRFLSESFRDELADFVTEVSRLKERLLNKGFKLIGNEALKLSVSAKSIGCTGFELAEALAEDSIVCEFADRDHLVLMLSPVVGKSGLAKLEKALVSLEIRTPISECPPVPGEAVKAMSPREAMFAPSVLLPLKDCLGRILADPGVSCPPAVPVLVCGEVIDENAVRCFEYYGIEQCSVVK